MAHEARGPRGRTVQARGGIRLGLLALTLLLAPACMQSRLAKQERVPWTRDTTVAEDALWTLESAAIGVVVVGGLLVTLPFRKEEPAWDYSTGAPRKAEPEEEDDGDSWPFDGDNDGSSGGSRARGGHGSHGGRRRAVGTRSSRRRSVRGTRSPR